jgi:hypothetical protein
MVYMDHEKNELSWQNSNMSSNGQLYTKLEHKSPVVIVYNTPKLSENSTSVNNSIETRFE